MNITIGFLSEEPTCSEPELAELEELFGTILQLASECVAGNLQLTGRVSNTVEAEIVRRNTSRRIGCILVQPFAADHILVELPSSAGSHDLAAELLADRSDILVIAARTEEQAKAAVRKFLYRAGDRRPEVVGIRIDDPSILGVFDLSDSGLGVRPLHHLLVAIPGLARQERAKLPLTPEPGWTLGGLYPLLFQFKTGQFKIHDFQTKSPLELQWPRDAQVLFGGEFSKLEAIREQLVSTFTAADQLGIYYGNLFRTLCIVILGLHLSAVTLALVFSVASPEARLLPSLEVIALFVALALFVWGHARNVLRKWVDYRLLAELIRPTPYFLALGRFFHPRAPDISPESLEHWRAVVRTYRDLMTSVNCPALLFTEQYVYGTVQVLRSFVEGQVNWHRGFARQHEAMHRWLARVGGAAFVVVFLTALANAFASLNGAGDSLEHAVLWIAIIVPMLGFAISIVLHQLGFEHIAERSAGAADRLQSILHSVDGHHGPILQTHLQHWAAQCEQAVAEEQSSWYRQTARIGFHL